jgi:glycine/D-amino acid oxidase-like deaminating enzyme
MAARRRCSSPRCARHVATAGRAARRTSAFEHGWLFDHFSPLQGSLDGLYYFTGDNGSSVKTAPTIGKALAEWVVQGQPSSMDPRPFRASRFAENDPLVGAHDYGDRTYDLSQTKVMLG